MLQRPEMPGRALKLVSRLSGLGTGGRVDNHRRTMRWRRCECGGFFGDAVRGEGARGWRQSTRGYRWDVSRYRVSFVMMSLFAPSETRSQCRLGSGCAGVDMEMDDLLFCRKNRLSRTFGGPPWSPCSSLQPVSLIVRPPLLLKMVRASNARAISWQLRIQWTKSTDVSPREAVVGPESRRRFHRTPVRPCPPRARKLHLASPPAGRTPHHMPEINHPAIPSRYCWQHLTHGLRPGNRAKRAEVSRRKEEDMLREIS